MTKTARIVRDQAIQESHNRAVERNQRVANVINAVTGAISGVGSLMRGAGALHAASKVPSGNVFIPSSTWSKMSKEDQAKAKDLLNDKRAGKHLKDEAWKWLSQFLGKDGKQ